jgi:hypothetical protein
VVSSISQFDTTNLYNQIQSDLASFKSTEQAEFQEWFENLQTVLDSNTAAHLQNEIDGLNSSKANKSDITNISIAGTTNNTGSAILAGTLFYLNGTLCKALTDIANGATFTEGTNYSTWTLKNTQDMINKDISKFYVKLPTQYYDGSFDFSVAKVTQILSDFISIAGTEERTGFILVKNGGYFRGQFAIVSGSYFFMILNNYGPNGQYKLSFDNGTVRVQSLSYS